MKNSNTNDIKKDKYISSFCKRKVKNYDTQTNMLTSVGICYHATIDSYRFGQMKISITLLNEFITRNKPDRYSIYCRIKSCQVPNRLWKIKDYSEHGKPLCVEESLEKVLNIEKIKAGIDEVIQETNVFSRQYDFAFMQADEINYIIYKCFDELLKNHINIHQIKKFFNKNVGL